MSVPILSEIRDLVRHLLNDVETSGGEVYTDDVIDHSIGFAFREMIDALKFFGFPAIIKEVVYSLPANTLTLTPATLGATDFDEPRSVEERVQGGTGLYNPVNPLQKPPQREVVSSTLDNYRWESGVFYFTNCSTARQIRVRYASTTPTIPTTPTGSLLIDNSQNFLSYRAASIAAMEKGADADEMAKAWKFASLGADLKADGSGGYLAGLCSAMERARGRQQAQRPASVKVKS